MKHIFGIFLVCQFYCCSLLLLLLWSSAIASNVETDEPQLDDVTDNRKLPTILIVTLLRNKAHTLPHFFTYLNHQDYPKERISLWLRTDHNEDQTLKILQYFLYKTSTSYHHVNIEYENVTRKRDSEQSSSHWPSERYEHVIRLKEQALNYGREIWADYIFFLDADVFLTHRNTLRDLIALNQPIVAPMLLSDGLYSNFWCGMTTDYYYQRMDEYQTIYKFDKRGQFPVPMVHSAVLINLNDKRSDSLTFNKTILGERFPIPAAEFQIIPTDDIIIFALSANYSHIPLHISNDQLYGYVTVPIEPSDDMRKDVLQVVNLKVIILNEYDDVNAINVDREFERFVEFPEPDSIGFDKVFMINLLRRPERRIQMERSFKEIGLSVEHVPAIDGRKLTYEHLHDIGIRFLPGYADPFHNRPMTMGEIGCFLSHFWIWEKQVVDKLSEILILEDDIRFEPYFKENANNLMREARRRGNWDLIYFGRKRMVRNNEKWVNDSEQLVYPSYSYWTLGYALSLQGAKKLLAAQPLDNMIPVDEFLPIMFNQHKNDTWKKAFPTRNLIAWSAAPLLLFPTRYIGEDGYLSDTEESITINPFEAAKSDKETNNDNEMDQVLHQSNDEIDSNASTTNDSINTTFILENVNEQTNIDKPSKQKHTEL